MTYSLDYDELYEGVGGADIPVRLFPVRLYMLDKLLSVRVDHWLDTLILQPLRFLTPNETWKGPYHFDPQTFCRPADLSKPPSDCPQFASDLRVFGLQEAIVYLHSYPFIADPTLFVGAAIGLCNTLQRLYAKHQTALLGSEDNEIATFMTMVALYHGERIGSVETPEARGFVRNHLTRAGIAIYDFVTKEEDEWQQEMKKAIGCSQDEVWSGESGSEMERILGPDWQQWQSELYDLCLRLNTPEPTGPTQATLDLF